MHSSGQIMQVHVMMIKTLKEKGGTAATAPITTVGFLLFFSGLLFVGAFLAASWADHTVSS